MESLRLYLLILLVSVFTLEPRTASGEVPASQPTVAALIAQLGDPDPAARRSAATSLKDMGTEARPALLDAARQTDSPQIAAEAGRLLTILPWWTAQDTPEATDQLKAYGPASVSSRIAIITQIAQQPNTQPTLLRLLNEELNEDICWQIEAELRAKPTAEVVRAARAMNPATARPSALVLAGRLWLAPQVAGFVSSPALALAALQKAIDLETAHPSFDNGELDFAFDEVCAAAMERGDTAQALHLRRLQVPRIGLSRADTAAPFFELLALHADYGPLADFDSDLTMGDAYLAQPEALCCLARIFRKCNDSLHADICVQLALSVGSTAESRQHLILFLVDHGWDDLTERACNDTLARGQSTPDIADIDAHTMLGMVALRRGDEDTASKELLAGLDTLHAINEQAQLHNRGTLRLLVVRYGQPLNDDDAERYRRIQAKVYAFHAAKARHDAAATDRLLDELMQFGGTDSEAAVDVVPELKSRGRVDDAKKFFDDAYKSMKQRIDSGNPDPVLANDTAWLCSRCGEHLDEAVKLADRAIAAMPDNAAFMDTWADARFSVGQADEAVRMETKAIQSRPDDAFMKGQLERFKKGTTRPSTKKHG